MTVLFDAIGWALVHFLWQGTLLTLLAGIALRLLRRASPQVRYLVACAALMAMTASVTSSVARNLSAASSIQSDEAHTTVRAAISQFEPAAAPATTPSIRSASQSAADWVRRGVLLWLAGVMVMLIRLVGGLVRVHQLHRRAWAAAASPWQPVAARIAAALRIRRTVHTVSSGDVDTPMVIGWLRPVVILPVAALAQMSPEQVRAILVHELAHIRRLDFGINLLQALAETVLFYHPGVWWISRRIRIEREHCCDDMVIDRGGDPLVYASALAALERSRLRYERLVVAASSGSLVERVRRVLDRRERRHRSQGTLAVVLGLIVMVAAVGTTALPAWQDDGAAARRQERAAEWKFTYEHGSGRFGVHQQTVRELVRFAYDLDDERVVGGPSWMDTERFDLEEIVPDNPVGEELPRLVQRMLVARFGFHGHEDRRQFPVLELVRTADGSPGPALHPSAVDCRLEGPTGVAGLDPCDPRRLNGELRLRGVTMAHLASALTSAHLGSEVVDRTGLSGTYDVTLNFVAFTTRGVYDRWLSALFEFAGYPSVFTAVSHQLGLELRDGAAPLKVMVVDRLERPLAHIDNR